jgi:hypothetical protein
MQRVYSVRNISDAKLRSMGFNVRAIGRVRYVTRGPVRGFYVTTDRFTPVRLVLRECGSERDMTCALRDVTKISGGIHAA